MVGGTVVKVIKLSGKLWIKCEEDNTTSQCALYIERDSNAEKIAPGDSLWWQGGWAMWTPFSKRFNDPDKPNYVKDRKAGVDYDIKIKRIGFSGVGEPKVLETK